MAPDGEKIHLQSLPLLRVNTGAFGVPSLTELIATPNCSLKKKSAATNAHRLSAVCHANQPALLQGNASRFGCRACARSFG
jgi:deoxycytidylate deaminase